MSFSSKNSFTTIVFLSKSTVAFKQESEKKLIAIHNAYEYRIWVEWSEDVNWFPKMSKLVEIKPRPYFSFIRGIYETQTNNSEENAWRIHSNQFESMPFRSYCSSHNIKCDLANTL